VASVWCRNHVPIVLGRHPCPPAVTEPGKKRCEQDRNQGVPTTVPNGSDQGVQPASDIHRRVNPGLRQVTHLVPPTRRKASHSVGAIDRCRQERTWHRPTGRNTSHAMRRLVSSTADVPGNHLDMKPTREFQVPALRPTVCVPARHPPGYVLHSALRTRRTARRRSLTGSVNRKAWSDVPEFLHRFVWVCRCLANRPGKTLRAKRSPGETQ